MGSSKKSKDKDRDREHKKKKRHRSRSRSRDRDRHDRHEKKSRREEKEKKKRDKQTFDYDHKPVAEVAEQKVEPEHVKEQLSLSIDDTNKIRAKLGLKPLDTGGTIKKDEEETDPTKREDTHVPATNMAHVKKTTDLREKMAQMKEKRRINMMLGKVKALGDSDSDDDNALSWVKKSRKLTEEKQKAALQAKKLQEMDEEFGIGDLVEEEFNVKKKYTSRDLTGMKVQHDQERFHEGRTTILTLQDRGILEDGDDTLVNVNIVDEERADKFKENKKKKPVYNPYADADEFDEKGNYKAKELLEKYDEEIEGERKESFQLGRGGKYNAEHEKALETMRREHKSRGESLALPPPMIAKEFYSSTEMNSFKKVKKKTRKLRKKVKAVTADDLLALAGDDEGENFGSRHPKEEVEPEEGEIPDDIPTAPIPGLDLVKKLEKEEQPDPFDDMDTRIDYEDLQGVVLEEDSAALELEMVLQKTRKIRQKTEKTSKERDRAIAEKVVKEEMPTDEPIHVPGKIVLNATSEFCRTLGEIPTYGLAGNRPEEEDEIMDFEQELVAQRRLEMEETGPGWQQVVELDTRPVEIKEEEKAVLDDEPVLNEGLHAALDLANKKGYLEKESKKATTAPTHKLLESQDYSIEDKRYEDLDEKSRKRDRFGGGPTGDFKEKAHYKPNVKLEYMDEGGRAMNEKEAFRYLSHRFHGKGSGMRKIEKRQKKQNEIMLMKNMNSTDTPLGTVALLREKQKVDKTPYILLSGKQQPSTSLSK